MALGGPWVRVWLFIYEDEEQNTHWAVFSCLLGLSHLSISKTTRSRKEQ